MTTKTFRAPLTIKKAETGQVSAIFAHLSVKDHDKDVILPGAFRDGQDCVIEPWNHNYGELPVGKGRIHEKGDQAILEGQFFLDTQGGEEHFRVLKSLPFAEWSFTFNIISAHHGKFQGDDVQFLEKLDVWGVAPVTRGAGIDTRTVSIKSGSKQTWLLIPGDAHTDRERLLAKIDAMESESWAYVERQLEAKLAESDAAAPQETGAIAAWRRTLLDEGHSEPWVNVVVDSMIIAYATELRQNNPLIFYSDQFALQEACRYLSQLQGPIWMPDLGLSV